MISKCRSRGFAIAPSAVIVSIAGSLLLATAAPGQSAEDAAAACNKPKKGWLTTGNCGTGGGFGPGSYFVGTTDAQPLIFKTAGEERFRIDPTGKLGIGTTTPGFALDVVGTLNATGGGIFNGPVGIETANPAFTLDVAGTVRATGVGLFGGVGVGTTSPAFTLDVTGSLRAGGGGLIQRGVTGPRETLAALEVKVGPTGEAGLLVNESASNGNAVLKLIKQTAGTGDFLKCTASALTETQKCHITSAGSFVAGSDFAESLEARGSASAYEPGDVIVLSMAQPGAVEKAARPYDTRVVGIFSTRPAVLGADKEGDTRIDPQDIPVAVIGIVPTKVTAENGPIEPGDLLTTSSTVGHAMKAKPVVVGGIEIYPTGTILGKAMGALPSGTGVIKILLVQR